jgi:uncharacterized FlaG/YvyC family protein
MNIGPIAASDTTAPQTPAAAASGNPVPNTGTSVQSSLPPVVPVMTPQTTSTSANNPEPSSATLQQSVSSLNAHLQNIGNNSVEFSVNSSTGQVVVQVIDTQTQTVLMQTPSKEAVATAQAQAQDNPRGLLIKTQA